MLGHGCKANLHDDEDFKLNGKRDSAVNRLANSHTNKDEKVKKKEP